LQRQAGIKRQVGITSLLALIGLESIAVIVTYQFAFPIECHTTDLVELCRGLRISFISAICAVTAFVILMCTRRQSWQRLRNLMRVSGRTHLWGVIHLSGVLIMFLPVHLIPPQEANERFAQVFMLLATGGALTAVGALCWVVRPANWWQWLKGENFQPLAILLLAALIPFLAQMLEPLWAVEMVSQATFQGVALLLSAVEPEVFIEHSRAWIGLPGFVVAVASQCSGIEGFALITGFMAIYAILFRETLRQGVFWCMLWPAALLASWLFNIVRITVLILLGKHVSPELAVNGFHSFAGWLLFIMLALGVLYLAQSVPALRRAERIKRDDTTLGTDPIAALIIPFITFMVSGIIAHAFWENPAHGYPLQAAAMLGALLWMRRPLRAQIQLSLDPFAVTVGLAVGAVWVWFSAPAPSEDMPVVALSGGAFVIWALIRTVGTTLLVPVIEEAFFRGYLLSRLDTGTLTAKVVAIFVSTALFAALHGRFALAALAGLLFAAAMLRRGRLGDAVVAHVTANAYIAAVAWYTGQWSLI